MKLYAISRRVVRHATAPTLVFPLANLPSYVVSPPRTSAPAAAGRSAPPGKGGMQPCAC